MQRLFGWFVSESALIWFLHRSARLFPVDWSDFDVWVRFTPPDQVVMAAGRYLALALAYWLLLSSTTYSVGLISDLPNLVRSVEWGTLPVVRNAARRAVALTMATVTIAPSSVMLSPSVHFNHDAPAGPVIQVDGADRKAPEKNTDREANGAVISVTDNGLILPPGATVTVPKPTRPSVATPRLVDRTQMPARATDLQTTEIEPNPPVTKAAATEYQVIDGDSLWSIATHHLAASHPEAPLSDREIARYWVQVVGLNRASLTSKNPDMIFPGEVIVLPPVDG
ncbi:MAG: hypothetical protein JJE47_09020 [Acidimicrobiia bacterium]|nr:hypothetical protein [Acidimicrobiia bacterium]